MNTVDPRGDDDWMQCPRCNRPVHVDDIDHDPCDEPYGGPFRVEHPAECTCPDCGRTSSYDGVSE